MKKNTILILLIIGIMCSIGIGYAYLSAKLNIEAGVSIAKHCNDKGTLYGKLMCEASDTNGKVLELTNNTEGTDLVGDSTEKKPVRYFSGEVTNNNVIFAGLCWKALRTTETEGVKLIYNGTVGEGNTCDNGEPTILDGLSAFNDSKTSLSFAGLMNNTSYNIVSKTYTDEELIESNANIYSASFTYVDKDAEENPVTPTYTLSNEENDRVTFYNFASYTNELDKAHYTCFNNTGTCTDKIYYLFNVDATNKTIYYIELTDGKTIEDAIAEMLTNDDVNTNESSILTALNTWYMTYIAAYDQIIEDTSYCNERTVSNLGGWAPTGSMTSNLQFYGVANKNLTCANNINRFSLSVQNGNGASVHKVGLLTAGEASLAGNSVINNGTGYWLMTPSTMDKNGVKAYYVNEHGVITEDYVDAQHGVRPVISVVTNTKVTSGEGTLEKPYILSTSLS